MYVFINALIYGLLAFMQPRLLVAGILILCFWVVTRRGIKSGSIILIIGVLVNLIIPATLLYRNYNAIASRFGLVKRNPLVTDADAFAFVEAAGIADQTQQAAINNLVIGLKINNLWNKMQVVYPFVGGSAYAHKFNLKNK